MINTIFYFTDTQLEYTDNYAQGSVKPHTICFAKDTKTIWRDGQRFSGLRQDEVDDEIHQLTDEAINDLNEGVQNLEFGLNTAVQAAALEKIRLNGEISRIDGEIADTNENLLKEHQALLNTAEDIQGKLDRGEVAYNKNAWNPELKAFLQSVQLWDEEDSTKVTKWSTLRLSVDNVSSEVNLVRQTDNGHYTTLNSKIDQTASNITSEVNRVEAKANGYNDTLQSKINQEVTDRGKAVTTLSNTFAKSTKDLQGVIEWMYSGLHSGASADMSYAEIIAAGKNGTSSAISDLRTSIETTSDGKYVAQSSLTSSVDKAISGIVNDVTGKYANTSVFSQIDTNSDNIAAINAFIGPDMAQSTLVAKLNKAEAGAVATVKDDLASMHILSKSGDDYTADVYTKAETKGEIKSATTGMATTDDLLRSMGLVYTKTEADRNSLISEAGLITENEFTSASIIAKVNDASSSVKINADHINIDANHQLDLSALTVTVDADDINLVGQTHFEDAIGNMITTKSLKISDVNNLITTVIESGNATFSGDVIAKTLTAGDVSSLGLNIYTTGTTIQFRKGSDNRAYFTSNGSGLQLYVKNETGDWYCIDFTNWKAASGGDYQTINCYNYQTGSDSTHKVTLVPEKYYYDPTTGLYYINPNSSGTIPAGTTVTTYEKGYLSNYYLYNVVSLVYGPNQQYDVADPIGINVPVEYLRKVQITRTSKTYTDEYIFLAAPFMARQMHCDEGDPTLNNIYQREYVNGYEFVKVGTSNKSVRWAENPDDESYAVNVNDVTIPANHIVVPADSNYPTVYNGIPFGQGSVPGMPTN